MAKDKNILRFKVMFEPDRMKDRHLIDIYEILLPSRKEYIKIVAKQDFCTTEKSQIIEEKEKCILEAVLQMHFNLIFS